MLQNIAPTKANLFKLKDTLNTLKIGYTIIDKKRTVLIKTLMQEVETAKEIQAQTAEKFEAAYQALENADIAMGIREIQDIAISMKEDEGLDISYTSIMGLDVPTVSYKERKLRPNYSLFVASPEVDIAISSFRDIKYLIYKLAETENKVFKLATEIKKNQKRANALEKIQIPEYKETIKFIENTLEEKEREDFYRLKKVKKKKISG